ncbi:vitamin K epoxide reductase complex subunit 1 [Periplaneta americana]|uniref:vitamin K epoxide reductase complex subunit 1 n=1 Tax=Periplaneta americana TaxID=6978 RepID=UPI0037E93340
MWKVKDLSKGIHLVCFFGLGLSYYAYVVETAKEHDENYVAMCDISEHMSCSKAFMSPYGKGFGLIRHIFGEDSFLNQPNSIGGMIFYVIIIGLNVVNNPSIVKLMTLLAAVSNLASVYLACILYFVLYDFCFVCVSTYVVNFLLLILCILKMQKVQRVQSPGKPMQKKRD